MDRPLSNETMNFMRRKRVLSSLLGAIIIATGFWAFRNAISPGVDASDISTSVVERGDVKATISASGIVVPRHELVISANFNSEVRNVLAVAGAGVSRDDPILVLDSRPLEVEINDLEEKLALKENERISAGLKLDRSTSEANGRYELRKIDLESNEAKFQRLSILAKSGLISKGELLEAELDVRRTSVELTQLEEQMANQLATNKAELDRITLEAAILQNQLDERTRLLGLTTVRAPQSGVLTWVQDEIGTSITQGAPLVRIADLSSYRIEATLSDFYASRLHEGLQATVNVSGADLSGKVQSVLPTVENGAMKLLVDLDNPSANGLRPQLRVEVEVITGFAVDTLRIRKGLGINGTGLQQLYRLTDGRARRTPVQLGLSNRNFVEILDGLSVGDVVIVSDSSEFQHLAELEVK